MTNLGLNWKWYLRGESSTLPRNSKYQLVLLHYSQQSQGTYISSLVPYSLYGRRWCQGLYFTQGLPEADPFASSDITERLNSMLVVILLYSCETQPCKDLLRTAFLRGALLHKAFAWQMCCAARCSIMCSKHCH